MLSSRDRSRLIMRSRDLLLWTTRLSQLRDNIRQSLSNRLMRSLPTTETKSRSSKVRSWKPNSSEIETKPSSSEPKRS